MDDDERDDRDERPAGSRGSRRAPLLAVLAAGVVLAVVGGVVATRSGGGGADPDRALADAREALEAADSYRLTATLEDRSVSGEAGGAGTDMTTRRVVEAEVSDGDWRMRADSGDWVDEAVGVDGQVYSRSADDQEGLAGEPWVRFPAPPQDLATDEDSIVEMLVWMAAPAEAANEVEELAVDAGGYFEVDDPPVSNAPLSAEDATVAEELLVPLLGELYLGGFGGPAGSEGEAAALVPGGFAATLGALDDAEVVAEDAAGLTLRATRSLPPEAADRVGMPLPPGEIEVVLDADGRPATLRVTVEGTTASHHSEVRFSDWDAGIAVGVPDGEIDETPWIDEEGLAAARAGLTPLAPTVLPEGWALVDIQPYAAEVIDGEDPVGTEACPQIDLVYGPGSDPESWETWEDDYLDLYLMSATCAREADPTPFAPGAYGDLPTREAEYGLVQVLVGDTVVEVDTTLGDDVVTAALTSLAPLDLDAEIARVAAEAEGMWAEAPG
ncbi:MAG TPA: hypothetical protein VFI47_30910 [Acidimicrobiales bacterium]|nr:hypothetical protein [Acidimicrobiales bacterium]